MIIFKPLIGYTLSSFSFSSCVFEVLVTLRFSDVCYENENSQINKQINKYVGWLPTCLLVSLSSHCYHFVALIRLMS